MWSSQALPYSYFIPRVFGIFYVEVRHRYQGFVDFQSINNWEEMAMDDRIIKGPPLQVKVNCSLGQYLIDHLRKHEDHVCKIDAITGQFQTNKDILEKSIKLAEILKSRGIKLEDRITISAENHQNWFIAATACLYVGATVAPLNPAYTELEIKHMLNIWKPRIIFVSRRTEKLLVKVVPTLSWPIQLIELDDEALTSKIPTLKSLLNSIKDRIDLYQYNPVDIDDINKRTAVILSSSGTTGLPKGVALSHRNLLYYFENIKKPPYLCLNSNERVLLFLPFYHGYAFSMGFLGMVTGCTLVVMRKFSPELLFSTIEKYRITFLPLVPSALIILAKHPAAPSYDFRSVKEVFCGAAPMPKEILKEAKRRLNVSYIRNGYGMTELSIVVGLSNKSGANDDAIADILPGLQYKIINPETLEILGPMQRGELCVKGEHSLMLGYYGYQVSPVELETLLLSNPGIKDVAVIGKPHQESGELPMAFVVKQPNSKLTAREIMDFVKEKVSPQKWLRGGVRFVDAVPRTPSGKILRRELQKMVSKL
ncbi:hypothetical protein KPH14_005799 [Odynerus spinipes]|uniref:Firefly luciferase n=1 Tax=Odynerus spinipes TaxID=1348599 RepID=A0AAD9VJ23_9HYME|nr:hypothetical protein KPH14_005799 [Odynerus spinipes]